ncbi:MAG: nitrate/nitrite transporter NrtS [Cyanobacteria bacterium P01_F01_bin.86]
MKTSFIVGYFLALGNPAMIGTALQVALVVGSILFAINHGTSVIQGKMTQGRWASGLLTYCVPYAVSIHGQYVAQRQRSQ